MTVADRYYFEDLVVGRSLETPAITLTQAHAALFLGFAGEGHDGAEARDGCVPDLLPLCLSSGLGWRVSQPPLAVLAFMGLEWSFLRPLRVGDTILSRSATVSLRALREGGVLVESRQIVDQDGEVVQQGRLTLLVARRPPTEG